MWDVWASMDKKKGKKNKVNEELSPPPPPVPTPPAQGLTPEPEPFETNDLDDLIGDTWTGLGPSKSRSSIKKGTLVRTNTSTSKTSKSSDTKSKFSPQDDKSISKKEAAK